MPKGASSCQQAMPLLKRNRTGTYGHGFRVPKGWLPYHNPRLASR